MLGEWASKSELKASISGKDEKIGGELCVGLVETEADGSSGNDQKDGACDILLNLTPTCSQVEM